MSVYGKSKCSLLSALSREELVALVDKNNIAIEDIDNKEPADIWVSQRKVCRWGLHRQRASPPACNNCNKGEFRK